MGGCLATMVMVAYNPLLAPIRDIEEFDRQKRLYNVQVFCSNVFCLNGQNKNLKVNKRWQFAKL